MDILLALSYNDVLLVPRHSDIESRSDVDLSTQITPHVKLSLPLISINMGDVTDETMAIAIGKLGGLGLLHRFLSYQAQAEMVSKVKKAGLKAAAAIGIKEGELLRAETLAKAGVDIITIDVAHGAMQKVIEITKILKSKFKKIDIIPGVIATYEGARELFKAGADSVRVGVGAGTICTTRIVSGVGVPQITAVTEAARAAREYGKTILCDGGTVYHGDIVKGLAAGASAVIIGSQFAGCDETPGKVVISKGKKFKVYKASTSFKEKSNHIKNGITKDKKYINHIEGVESMVPYKGPLKGIITSMEANVRAGFSYCGAKNIPSLWKKAKFVRITSIGIEENHPHGVIVTSQGY